MEKHDKIRSTMYVEKSIYKNLKFVAVALDKKVNDCIKEALEEYIKKHSKFLPKL